MIKIETQPPKLSPFSKFNVDVKKSFEEFKEKHNQIANTLTKLEKEFADLKINLEEITEFLTFTNRKYRRFFHKKHLKNKFK